MNPFKRSSATIEDEPVDSNVGDVKERFVEGCVACEGTSGGVHIHPKVDFSPLRPGEWQRSNRTYALGQTPPPSASREAPSVPFLSKEPQCEGLYWWRPRDYALHAQLCVVIEFGGNLCVRTRRGDSSTYVNVSALAREWAGPLPIGDGMRLRDLAIE